MISDDTDKALRTFLDQTGEKKGDLSSFVEQVVRDKLFELTVGNIKKRNTVFDQNELMDLINQAVVNVRQPAPLS